MLEILGHLPYNGRTIHIKSEIKIQMNFAILASLSNLIYFLFICFDTLRRNKLKNSIIENKKKNSFLPLHDSSKDRSGSQNSMWCSVAIAHRWVTCFFCSKLYIQYNLNGSNPDGSFTLDDSNSFFSPYKILPIAQENKYLGILSYFIMKLYVVCTH